MTIGVLLTAFTLGLRHGVDWDHIAAIADLSGTAESRWRGFVLSFLYAVGHAAVVFVLGVLVIFFSASLPVSVADWMSRVVGLTLVALGVWVIVGLLRQGRDFRLQSRWMLVFSGTFAGIRRVRQGRAGRQIVVDHEHEHPHLDEEHIDLHAHDHSHRSAEEEIDLRDPVVSEPLEAPVLVGAENASWSDRIRNSSVFGHSHRPGSAHSHSHSHSHKLALPDQAGYGNGSATGIGVLHGIGVESPTQIAVFVASSAIGGMAFGLMLLLAWVVGLVVANSILALLAAFGLLHAERNFGIYATLAVVVGVASIVVGGAMMLDIELLPAIEL